MRNLVYIFSLLLATTSHASRVAVVDSGTDLQHAMIKDHLFKNVNEIPDNRVDDDHNGKADDYEGWNFIEGSSKVFAFEQLKSINPIVYPLITVIAHRQGGINTPAEDKFFADNVTSLSADKKTQLIAHLNYFGEYVHSTHVSGIILQQNPLAQVMSARVFPNEPPPLYSATLLPRLGPIDWIYKLLAIATNGTFKTVADYLNEMHMDVANYSLGMALSTLAKGSLTLQGNSAPTEAQIEAETQRLFAQFDEQGKAWMAASPSTLFVIAAGNDGTDNDVLPAFPGNIRVSNAICVAATLGYHNLATFSNTGATTVDVAAPGVSIVSSVPSVNQAGTLPLSGTSMAAPFVTGVASRVKDANAKLTPQLIRQILMGTVDKKDWLVGKVVSAGIVNSDRAAAAGLLSLTMSVEAAISISRTTVADAADTLNGPQLVSHGSTDLNQFAKALVF